MVFAVFCGESCGVFRLCLRVRAGRDRVSRPSRPWFRFYVEAVGDPKLRTVTPAQRWLWVGVLAAARHSPKSGTLLICDDMPMTEVSLAAFAGVSPGDVRKTMPVFERLGMIDIDDQGAWFVTNWADRQYESDDVTVRTRKYRSREQDRNVPNTFPGTPPETETDLVKDLSSVKPLRVPPEQATPSAPARLDEPPIDPQAGAKLRGVRSEMAERWNKK